MPNFGDLLIKGAKSVLDQQLNKRNGNSNQNSSQQSQGDMNYGGGYQNQGGYPNQGGGYPQSAGGYPPSGGGYPGGGYPPSNPGYQPYGQQPQSGYPPQQQQGGYGGGVTPIGFGGYPPSQPSYPQGPGYPGSQAPYPQEHNYGGTQMPPTPSGYNSQMPTPAGSISRPNELSYGGSTPGGYQPNLGPQPTNYPPPPAQNYPSMGAGYGGGMQPQQYQQQQFGGQGAAMGTPSIRYVPSNANTDAEALRKAMKGLGCNNNKVVSVLCSRTNQQRQEIARAFKVMYGKDLIQDLKAELHGDFEDLIIALMTPPAQYDAQQLHKAMAGLGTKESVLIEIMTSRTNAQINELKYVYQSMYRSSLEKDLISETSGWFKRLLISMCAGGRDESYNIDPLRANQDARKLLSAGEKRLGTDEACFNSILAAQNFAQLRLVFDEYQKASNHSIEQAIRSEFSGDIRDGLLAVCAVIRNRAAYFAQLLHDSMKGLGTRDNDLIRLVVTRAEIDMGDIRNEFQRMFKTSLEAMIKGDCSGSYKDGLIALVKGNA